MNGVQSILKEQWDQVRSRYDISVGIWVASVLAAPYDMHNPGLEIIASLITDSKDLAEARAECAAVKVDREAIRSQFTTMNNAILRKIGPTSLRQPADVQDVFDDFVERAWRVEAELRQVKHDKDLHYEKMRRRLESIARNLGHVGWCEALDTAGLASRVRQEADAKASYERLATARRTRLDAVNEALGTEDCRVFDEIERLKGLEVLMGVATNAMQDVRNILNLEAEEDLVEGVTDFVEFTEETLARRLCVQTAIRKAWQAVGEECPDTPTLAVRTLGLRVVNGQKAIDQLVDLGKVRAETLEFYADPANWRLPGGSITERFFATSNIDRDQGRAARRALGRNANEGSLDSAFVRDFLGLRCFTDPYLGKGSFIIVTP